MRELRRRKVRFPLIVSDNIKIRRLEELKQHPDIKAILSSYEEGRLITWLRDRYEDEVADNIEALDRNSADFCSALLACLGIQANVQTVELSAVVLSNEKKNRVKMITDDQELIKQSDYFAFNSKQLEWLLKSDAKTIYLYEGKFKLNAPLRSVSIIGINSPEIDMCSYSFNDLRRAGVKCSGITLTSDKMKKVKGITEDEYIISNFEFVAFDDEEFDRLMNSDANEIWLYGEHFTLKTIKPKVTVKGINIPLLDLGEFNFNDLSFKEVEIEHIRKTSALFNQVKQFTDDSEILSNFECVAFDDERFHALLKKKRVHKIWLYGNTFTLLKIERPVEIIGMNDALLDIGEFSFNELKAKNIILKTVKCTSETLEKVRSITSDETIIQNFEKVAFSNEELNQLIQNSKCNHIYIYGDSFEIPFISKHVTIKGINSPNVELEKNKNYGDYIQNGINLVDVTPKDKKAFSSVDTNKLAIGKTFYLGKYNDNKIRWIVISQKEGTTIAIAANLKMCHPLESKSNNYKWSNCSLRKWLNGDFYNLTFNDFDRCQIIEATISCKEYNSSYEVKDKVYILSSEEIERIKDKNILKLLKGSWLRDSKYGYSSAYVIDYAGRLLDQITYKEYGVVPVITLKSYNM